MATVLDPRTKILYGIEDYELEELWTIMFQRAVKFVVVKKAGEAGATVSPAVSGVRCAAHVASSSVSKRPRISFMSASMAHAGNVSSAQLPLSSQDATDKSAGEEVQKVKNMPPFPIYGRRRPLGPGNLPRPSSGVGFQGLCFSLLTPPARLVLATPMSQAQLERLISSAVLIVT